MKKAIGIFDSGLGGLTVLKVLAKKFPNESFCYLGDIARLPYGNKSPETIRRYGLQILDFLKDQNVKAIIIACNSASTVFLGESVYEGIPLLNVIEPGAAAAIAISEDNKIGCSCNWNYAKEQDDLPADLPKGVEGVDWKYWFCRCRCINSK